MIFEVVDVALVAVLEVVRDIDEVVIDADFVDEVDDCEEETASSCVVSGKKVAGTVSSSAVDGSGR